MPSDKEDDEKPKSQLAYEDRCVVAKVLLTNCKRNHTRSCNSLMEKLNVLEVIPSIKSSFFKEEYAKSEALLDKLNDSFIKFLVVVDKEDNGELDKNYELQSTLSEKYHEKMPKPDSTVLSSSTEIKTNTTVTPKLKVPNLTTFSNSIRDYGRFKTEFRSHYEQYYSSHAHLVLKNNLLTGTSKDLCAAANSVDEVFHILDLTYGDTGKLVEVILHDLEQIPPCSENQLADLQTLKISVRMALVDLGSLKHFVTQYQTAVSLVRKLPTTVQRRWAEKIATEKIRTEDRFESLMSFIDTEIRTMELMADNFVVSRDQQSDRAITAPRNNPSYVVKTRSTQYCTVHENNGNHWPRWCKILRKKTVSDQVEWFLRGSGKDCCRLCLSRGHGTDGSKCPIKTHKECGKNGCRKKHATDYHDALEIIRKEEKPGNGNNVYTVNTPHFKSTLSPAQKIYIKSSSNYLPVGALIDTGSVITLVHNRLVRQANLKRISDEIYHVTMETVGGDVKSHHAYAYEVYLQKDKTPPSIKITALGVDNIGSSFPDINLDDAQSVFGLTADSVRYPSNCSLDILIGMDNAHLALTTLSSIDGLVLAENALGKVIFGSHPSFSRSSNPRHYRVTCYAIGNCTIPDLCATDILGVECTPKCGSCRCGRCAPGSGNLSLKEEHEYQLIKDGMKLEGNVVVAKYPWIKPPSELPNNYPLAHKRLTQLERRLQKDPDLAVKYEEQIKDMLDRGVARKLGEIEDQQWRSNSNNPIQYLPHHEVLKPSSKSTPVRIVFDPSSEFQGHAVNQYWGTGPNLICNAFGLQLRFRENMVAVVADIAKMYQTVYTTPMEWHCHRFLWRGLDQTKTPDTYIIVRNSFGSRPAAAIAIAALHLVADAGNEQFPIGARTIRDQSYVDDILDSTENTAEAEELIRQTEACLALGEFKVKGWTVIDARNVSSSASSLKETEIIDQTIYSERQIGGSDEIVLGTFWETKSDSLFLKAKINFSKRKKKIRQGPDLKINEIFTMADPLTLRSILSQVNGYYDPLGLVGPYLTELKYHLGRLWKIMNSQDSRNIWDAPIPSDHDAIWRNLLNTAFVIENVKFARHLKPDNSIGKPWLILFSDSSTRAFGCCAYIRWTLNDNTVWCRLIASKSRIWPIDSDDFLSLCKGELQGAVLAKRLCQTILREMRFSFEKCIFIIDSEIVRAQIAKDSHAFDVFVGNRVGEIRASTTPDQWYHTPGQENVSADLLSRGTTEITMIDRHSAWQTGPSFLHHPFEDWPISQHLVTDRPLPGLRDKSSYQSFSLQPRSYSEDPYGDCAWIEVCHTYAIVTTDNSSSLKRTITTWFDSTTEDAIASRINVSHFSKLHTLLATTYRILHALSWKPGDGHFVMYMSRLRVVDAEQLELAMQFWLRHTQRPLVDAINRGKFKRLKPALDETCGVYRLNGRFGTHPQGYHPILLLDALFTKLLITSIHRRAHSGVTSTSAKVRNEYHIIGLKNIVKSVRNSCTLCRRIEKRLLKCPMAPLPGERFRPAYAFEHCSCDIFGSFLLQVPGRVTRGRTMDAYGKGYGVIFTCLSTRAIHLEAMEGQDTSAFLLCLRRMISIRGQPSFMWSDNGKQIVGCDDELRSIVSDWSTEELSKFGACNGLKWQYNAPGSPWQNGVSEALIKSVKRSLAALYQNRTRTPIMELQTVFQEVSAILNERPINLGHSDVPGDWDIDVNTYLCPNHLLLGRSSIRIPAGPFGATLTPHAQRFHDVEVIVNQWWELWKTHYLPTLLTQSKWHHQDRQVSVGDIVYVRDNNAVRGQWQIAEVIRADPSSSDGLIRNVEIRYKRLPDGPTRTYTGTPDRTEIRDVKNLCILVTIDERKLKS